MILRRILTNAFILLALLVGSLYGLRLDRSIKALDRAGTLVLAASWPVSLEDLFPGEQRGGWVAPELIATEQRPWPEAGIRELPGATATLRSRAAGAILSLALRADMAFGTKCAPWILGSLVSRAPALLLAPQITTAGAARARADLLPGLFFAAYSSGSAGAALRLISSRPAAELSGLVERNGEGPQEVSGPWAFHFRYLDIGMYPALRAAAQGGLGLADGTRILLRYRVPGGDMLAFCRRNGVGNECGNDPAALPANERSLFSAWEHTLPPLEAELVGTRALGLLHRCERERLPPGEAKELRELILRRRAFHAGIGESTMPYALRRCGLALGDDKLAGVGSYWGRVQLVKNFQFTSTATLLSGIVGNHAALEQGAAPGEGPNWFSDYRRLFGPGLDSWAELAARNVPGLDPRSAPTPRSLRVLLALDSIAGSHNHDEFSRTFGETLLQGNLLSANEVEWIRRNRGAP